MLFEIHSDGGIGRVKYRYDVTEMVDGYRMIRVLPLTRDQQELSARCVQRPGYQGNNLLCSNWDAGHMVDLDYNRDTMMCDDALITHELTVRFREDESFQYLGNRILGDGLSRMPEYRYRVGAGTAVSGQTTEV